MPWEDIIAPELAVVFVGFNPSIPAWRTGHYYANPGNRFYALLAEVGLTPRLLVPSEDRTLVEHGVGAIDLLAVPSAGIDDLPREAFAQGAGPAKRKLLAARPRAVCCNGLLVFKHLFGVEPSRIGRVPHASIGASAVFVTPSTSGRVNGRAAERLAAFRELAAHVGKLAPRSAGSSVES